MYSLNKYLSPRYPVLEPGVAPLREDMNYNILGFPSPKARDPMVTVVYCSLMASVQGGPLCNFGMASSWLA